MIHRQKSPSRKIETYHVREPIQLLPFLTQTFTTKSRNSVKSILTRGQVSVNDEVITKHNFQLKHGDIVTIQKNKLAQASALHGVKILFEDDDIIVIEKDAGLLSIASPKEKQLTAYKQLMTHVRKHNPSNKIFIVHRLDRETSGVMMFAKSEKVKNKLQHTWKEIVKERAYVALVEGVVKQQEGTITSWLKESKTLKMYSSSQPNDGKLAVTNYKVIQSNKNFSLVEVHLETGRKNQIRVHMQDLGHPIVGDQKYGSKLNPIRRLGLHANVLMFSHPTTAKLLRFESEIPTSFIIS